MHPQLPGRKDVVVDPVPNHHGLTGGTAAFLQRGLEDAPVRFGQTLFRGSNDQVKELQNAVAVQPFADPRRLIGDDSKGIALMQLV